MALDTALPTKLSPPELRQWLLDKKKAMRKLRDGYETTALKLSRGDSTLSDLVEEIRADRVEAEAVRQEPQGVMAPEQAPQQAFQVGKFSVRVK